jgi:hypothetical protein
MFILSCLLILYNYVKFPCTYSLSIVLLLNQFYITVFIYLFSLYVCILYFNLFQSCICNFVIIVVTYFNWKFCSKFVIFYINYSCLSTLGLAVLLYEADLIIFRLFLYPLDELLYMDLLEYS